MRIQDNTHDDDSVNITPLIDIFFLLLIFFLVATTFQEEEDQQRAKAERSLEVELPQAKGDSIHPIDR